MLSPQFTDRSGYRKKNARVSSTIKFTLRVGGTFVAFGSPLFLFFFYNLYQIGGHAYSYRGFIEKVKLKGN